MDTHLQTQQQSIDGVEAASSPSHSHSLHSTSPSHPLQSGDSLSPPAVAATSSTSPTTAAMSPTNSSTHPPINPTPSRRVRVYRLQPDGNWCSWGIGWLFKGEEVPVAANDSSDKRVNILVKHEVNPSSDEESQHAPSGALGLPSLTAPTLLTLHVPNAFCFCQQGTTIVTFSTHYEAQHALNHHQAQQLKQLKESGNPVDESASQANISPSEVLKEGDEIDIALSFQTAHDADQIWQYIHSFPEVEMEEEARREEEARKVELAEQQMQAEARGSGGEYEYDEEDENRGQISPRSASLYAEEQMEDNSIGMVGRSHSHRHDQSADEDELQQLSNQNADSTPHARFFSNSGRPLPKSSSSAASSHGILSDDDDDEDERAAEHNQQRSEEMKKNRRKTLFSAAFDEEEEEEDEGGLLFSDFKSNASKFRRAGIVGAKNPKNRFHSTHTQQQPSDSSDEGDGEEEENFFLPSAVRVPSLENLERIYSHINSFLNPPNSPESAIPPRKASKQYLQQMNMPPFRKRIAFITEITKKSAVYRKNLLIFSAKKPIAVRATQSPMSATSNSPAPGAGASQTGTPNAAPSISATPSPTDLNWLENLSVLLRQIDEEIIRREESGITEPIKTQTQEEKVAEAAVHAAAAAAAAAVDVMNTNPVNPVPPIASAPLAPSQAPYSILLSCASLIQSIVSLLFSFNSAPFMQYLFECNSVHGIWYNWHLVLVSFEYERAEERWAKYLQSRGPRGIAAVQALWQRHRRYLQSVIVKSPFPITMTHVVDIVSMNVTTRNQPPIQPDAAALSAPPTKFCLLLLSSYFLQYVRDTFLYSPRTLDDPLQLTMNQQVVFKNAMAVMASMLQDSESHPNSFATNAAAGPGSGLKRTQSNFRAVHAAQLKQQAKRKSGSGSGASGEEESERWTNYIFRHITRAVEQEESNWNPAATTTSTAAAATNSTQVNMTNTNASSSGDVRILPSRPRSPDSTSEDSVPAPIVAPVDPEPQLPPFVTRLTSEWSPFLTLSFCSTLADFMYALHNIFTLTKNSNNPNGITAQQKEKLFNKFLEDGIVPCLERVLLFCRKAEAINSASSSTADGVSTVPASDTASFAPPESVTSLQSPSTLSWLRLLCLDMLQCLQTATPGFLRSFMQPHTVHVMEASHLSEMQRFERGNTKQQEEKTEPQTLVEQLNEESHIKPEPSGSEEMKDANAGNQVANAAVVKQEDQKKEAPSTNKFYRAVHENCRQSRLRLTQVLQDAAAKAQQSEGAAAQLQATRLSDSLLMLCFQIMTDTKVYAGLRQHASSLLRLALDPEYGRPTESNVMRTMFDESGLTGGPNLLVPLLAQGGVGSYAPLQLQYDSEHESDDELIDESSPRRFQNPMSMIQSMGMEAQGKREKKMTEGERQKLEARKREEAKRRRKQMKQRIRVKQNKVMQDSLLQLIYADPASGMSSIVDLLQRAATRWTQLQSAAAPMNSQQVAKFTAEFPIAILVDCVDFLCFLSLRHSVLFAEFAIENHVFDLIAAFFPRAQIQQAQAQQQMEAQKSGSSVMSTMNEIKSDVHSSASPPSLGTVTASPCPIVPFTYVPPPVTVPTSLLCCCLRFLRICVEVDQIFIQPIQTSNILLCLVELLLHNARPNLIHSSILELMNFIDSHRVAPLLTQLKQGIVYVKKTPNASPTSSSIVSAELAPIMHIDLEPIMMTNEFVGVQLASSLSPGAPLLPSAPDHPVAVNQTIHAPLPITTAQVAKSIPALNSLYDSFSIPSLGISRVNRLPSWPKSFRHLRFKVKKIKDALTKSEPATVKQEESVGSKRHRDPDSPVESESDEQSPLKKLKVEEGSVAVSAAAGVADASQPESPNGSSSSSSVYSEEEASSDDSDIDADDFNATPVQGMSDELMESGDNDGLDDGGGQSDEDPPSLVGVDHSSIERANREQRAREEESFFDNDWVEDEQDEARDRDESLQEQKHQGGSNHASSMHELFTFAPSAAAGEDAQATPHHASAAASSAYPNSLMQLEEITRAKRAAEELAEQQLQQSMQQLQPRKLSSGGMVSTNKKPIMTFSFGNRIPLSSPPPMGAASNNAPTPPADPSTSPLDDEVTSATPPASDSSMETQQE